MESKCSLNVEENNYTKLKAKCGGTTEAKTKSRSKKKRNVSIKWHRSYVTNVKEKLDEKSGAQCGSIINFIVDGNLEKNIYYKLDATLVVN